MKQPKKYRPYVVKGSSKRRPPGSRPPSHVPTPPPVSEPDESRQRKIYRQIGAHPGDELVAKRIETLEKKLKLATIPELLVYDWLKQQNMEFEFQPDVFGGRRVKGGMVPDFTVRLSAGSGAAWLVQGDYYHGGAFQRQYGQQNRDIEAEIQLKGKYIGGVRIDTVVQLFERDLYDRRPGIFWRAVQGGT